MGGGGDAGSARSEGDVARAADADRSGVARGQRCGHGGLRPQSAVAAIGIGLAGYVGSGFVFARLTATGGIGMLMAKVP